MRILVTNDDGIDSEGMHALARSARSLGHEVTIVAPNFDASGTGASLGPLSRKEDIVYETHEIPDFDGDAYSINGPPALCVIVSHLEAFGPVPDLVLSGINPGLNTGRSTLHSGTVGAVLTAQNFGTKGVAVSLHSEGESLPWFWDAATDAAESCLRMMESAKPKTALNVNVPALPAESVKGLKWARLAPFGSQRSALKADGKGNLNFGLVDTEFEPDNETDLGLVLSGYTAITVLKGVSPGRPMDTEYGSDLPERFSFADKPVEFLVK